MFNWKRKRKSAYRLSGHQNGNGHVNGNGYNNGNGHVNGHGHHTTDGYMKDRRPAQMAGAISKAAIDLQGIEKAYQTDAGPFLALKGIDLQVNGGEFVAVVGKSGSGKSTLINMFTGIDHPTAGEVIVAQTRIRTLDEGQMAQWRGKNMGIVFQFFQLLPTLTIKENVMIPMDLAGMYSEPERQERAMFLLEQVGMAGHGDKFPSAVSGGQQQSAAIARALANDPMILVADEPTGNLDSRTAESIFQLFESLVGRGKTVLMVTHDDELAARAPRTITLADGLIVDEIRRN
jgi:putative ABC transport system ATP-binding protein